MVDEEISPDNVECFECLKALFKCNKLFIFDNVGQQKKMLKKKKLKHVFNTFNTYFVA